MKGNKLIFTFIFVITFFFSAIKFATADDNPVVAPMLKAVKGFKGEIDTALTKLKADEKIVNDSITEINALAGDVKTKAEAAKKMINDAKTKTEEIKAKADEAKDKVEDLKTDKNDLDEKFKDYAAKLTEIMTTITNAKNKKKDADTNMTKIAEKLTIAKKALAQVKENYTLINEKKTSANEKKTEAKDKSGTNKTELDEIVDAIDKIFEGLKKEVSELEGKMSNDKPFPDDKKREITDILASVNETIPAVETLFNTVSDLLKSLNKALEKAKKEESEKHQTPGPVDGFYFVKGGKFDYESVLADSAKCSADDATKAGCKANSRCYKSNNDLACLCYPGYTSENAKSTDCQKNAGMTCASGSHNCSSKAECKLDPVLGIGCKCTGTLKGDGIMCSNALTSMLNIIFVIVVVSVQLFM